MSSMAINMTTFFITGLNYQRKALKSIAKNKNAKNKKINLASPTGFEPVLLP